MAETMESGYDRIALEKYYTPAWAIEALLSAVTFPGAVLEPAAGDGGLANVVRATGYETWCCDIAPEHPEVARFDFLDPSYPDVWEGSIITNPPYGKGGRLAEKFIAKALSMTREHRGKVAMLLRVDFDSASTRRHLFADHPAFDRQYALTKRLRWTNVEQKAEGPTKNHAWFVWDWERWGGPACKGYLP